MLIGITIWASVASLVTASLYVWDKRAAIKDRPRIAERTLLAWSLLGGWPGGWMAARLIRHKTSKFSYRCKFAICSTANIIATGTLAWSFWGGIH